MKLNSDILQSNISIPPTSIKPHVEMESEMNKSFSTLRVPVCAAFLASAAVTLVLPGPLVVICPWKFTVAVVMSEDPHTYSPLPPLAWNSGKNVTNEGLLGTCTMHNEEKPRDTSTFPKLNPKDTFSPVKSTIHQKQYTEVSFHSLQMIQWGKAKRYFSLAQRKTNIFSPVKSAIHQKQCTKVSFRSLLIILWLYSNATHVKCVWHFWHGPAEC